MKKIVIFLFTIVCMCVCVANAQMIVGSVSMTDKVPEEFFGEWQVASVCTKSTDKEYYGTTSVDIWILSRVGDAITLRNPVSGAFAQITVDDVKGQTVKFEKKSYYNDEISIETPILTLQGDKFSGTDTILIKTLKDGEVIKEDYIEYKVKGTKVSGVSFSDLFGFK